MANISQENLQKIGQYIWLSGEVCSELMSERDALLQEKEALEKQAEETSTSKPFGDEQVENTVKKMCEAGLVNAGEQKEAEENIKEDPQVLLKLVDKLADREMQDTSQLGDVEQTNVPADNPKRKSDEIFNQYFGG